MGNREASRSANSAPATPEALLTILRYEADANRVIYFNNTTGTLSLMRSDISDTYFMLRDYISYIVFYADLDSYSDTLYHLSNALQEYGRHPFDTDIIGVKHDGSRETIMKRTVKRNDS